MHKGRIIYSTIIKNSIPNIKEIVLPKINYLENHELLKKPFSRFGSLPNVNIVKTFPPDSPLDVTEEEICDMDWTEKEQEDNLNLELKNVKHLDHWIYEKGLHRHLDLNFRRTLMVSTIKRVAAIKLDSCKNDLDSYIIKVDSHLLKSKKIVDTERMSEKSNASNYSRIILRMADDTSLYSFCSPDMRLNFTKYKKSMSSI